MRNYRATSAGKEANRNIAKEGMKKYVLLKMGGVNIMKARKLEMRNYVLLKMEGVNIMKARKLEMK